jgi:hypothetical protein
LVTVGFISGRINFILVLNYVAMFCWCMYLGFYPFNHSILDVFILVVLNRSWFKKKFEFFNQERRFSLSLYQGWAMPMIKIMLTLLAV